jgi:hypothetical protein
MMVSAFAIGAALDPFTPTRLVQVIQGAAVLTVMLNVAALWKQEARNRARTEHPAPRPPFADVWRTFIAEEHTTRLLIAVGCGAAAFSMQDVLLEPYGGEILGLGVGQTTALTGLWAAGTLVGFALAGRWLAAGAEPHRIAGLGGVAGIAAFLMILFAAPLASPGLLLAGAGAIGFGAGLFSVGTLTAAMALARSGTSGLALGAWGAVQATCAGLAIALGGILRDLIGSLACGGCAWPDAGQSRHRLCQRLPDRDRAVARHPRRHRPACAAPGRVPSRTGAAVRPHPISNLKGAAMFDPILAGRLDVAELVFYAFVLFFIGLVFYLRREDRREGYPVEDEITGVVDSAVGPLSHSLSKSFFLPHGRGVVTTPTKFREPVRIAARRIDRFGGAPLPADRRSAGRRCRAGRLRQSCTLAGPGQRGSAARRSDQRRHPFHDRAARSRSARHDDAGFGRPHCGHHHRRLDRPVGPDDPLSGSTACQWRPAGAGSLHDG